MKSFKQLFFDQLKDDLLQAVLVEVQQVRQGQIANRLVLKTVIGIYNDMDMSNPIIKKTKEGYEWIAEKTQKVHLG